MHRILANNHLQAFRKHKIVDIFCSPGECDVTTNVDFALLKESMADLGTSMIVLCDMIMVIQDVQSRHMVLFPNATSSRAWA